MFIVVSFYRDTQDYWGTKVRIIIVASAGIVTLFSGFLTPVEPSG